MVYTHGITQIIYLWWYTWWYTYTIYHPWRAIHDIPLMLYHPRFTSLWYHTRYSTDCIPLMVYLMVYLYAIPPMVDHSWYTTHCIPPTWYTTRGIPPTVYISIVYTWGITNLYTLDVDGIHGGIPISIPPMVDHPHDIPLMVYHPHDIPLMVYHPWFSSLWFTHLV